MVVFYRPTQAKLARWASLLAEDDFELHHRPGHTNAVLDVLSRQPVPEETKNENDASSASFIDTLPPVAVSAYLVAVSGLCPYQLTPFPPTTSANFMLAVTRATADPSNSSSSADIRPSTPSLSDEPFTYLCSHRHDFINLQLQDPRLKVISKYQSAGSQKSALRNLPSREQSRIQNMARRCVLLEGLIMYSDKFLGDPGHLRIFVPDNKDVKSKLLQATPRCHLKCPRSRFLFVWDGEGNKTLGCKMFGMPEVQICEPATGLTHSRFYDKPINVLGIGFVRPFPKSANGNWYILTSV